jgi:3D (Asp-Asp-Asp) domain-containing protein
MPARGAATVVVALALLATSLAVPAAGAADAQAELERLEQAERSAVLELYAAEASLAAAQRELDAADARAASLKARERQVERRVVLVRGSLEIAERRVAETLRALYVEGDRADPIAVLLGAESLDAALEGLDGLAYAVRQNRRLGAQLTERHAELETALADVRRARAAADEARAGAAGAAEALEAAAAGKAATLSRIRSQSAGARAELASLEAQAAEAQRLSVELTRAAGSEPVAAGADAGSRTEAADAPPVTPEPPAAAAPGASTTLLVDAVAYHLPGRTASGLPVGVGVIAVDPTVIPLGTRVFVPGYGPAVAADVGSAIKGNIIDLWMPSTAQALAWGRRAVTITIYR